MSSLFGANITTFQSTATTTAARLTTQQTLGTPRANGGILVKALTGNAVTVYVGGSSAVTTSTGFPLEAGSTVSVPVDDPSKIYIICASDAPVVAVMYL